MNTIGSAKRRPNPVKNANIFSQLFFLYMLPIFKRSIKKEMTEDDIFDPLVEHKSSYLGDQLEKLWMEEFEISKNQKTALHRALFKLFGFKFMLYGIVKGIEECFMVVLLPISIGKVVLYFQSGQQSMSKNEVYMYSAFITFTFFMDTITNHPAFMGLAHQCMKMRIASSSLLYRKALRLSRTSLSKTTVGHIINLLSNDVSKFEEGFSVFYMIWLAPLQACIGLYLIYREIQVSAFFGMGFLLAFIPLQIWVGKRTSTLRLRTALRTDERVRLMNEMITGIQVIKMYCWEKPFAKLIELARRKEMIPIRAHQYLVGLIYAFEMFITRTSIFISVLSFVLLGNLVSAEKVFAITGIYNVIRPFITTFFSIGISSTAEVNVSIKRINDFLCHDEFTKDIHKDGVPSENNVFEKNTIINDFVDLNLIPVNGDSKGQNLRLYKKPGITLNNVSAVWLADAEEFDLDDLNLNIFSNELVAVIGPVGSGKSSLIHLFLKELTVKKGTMAIDGIVSYASQEPWLFSGTIRQNILFGEKYDKDHYDAVVKVCALEHDLEFFPFGDKTLVGERGKILSGGQKARINLARCIYKKADIYLLDDPLSAVDVSVGKHLYFECINQYLSDKICILVTHQLQYIHTADKILIMEDGKIQQAGTYEDLQTKALDFAKLLQKSDEKHTEKDKRVRSSQQSVISNLATEEKQDQFADEEEIGHGKIKLKTYYEYAKSGGNPIIILFLLATFIVGYTITFGGDYFITYWVNLEQDFATSNSTELPFSRNNIIYSYSGITLGTIIFAIGQTIFFMAFLTDAATNLHKETLDRVIGATMHFFNTNPSGRILNRFSEDIGVVDDYIPHIIFDVISIALLSVCVIVLASIVEWVMFPAYIILGIIFVGLRSVYIMTSRNVKRIEAITRSPMYSHITATLHGITTIRAFNAENILINEFDFFQDRNSCAHYLFLASSLCFGFWINFLCVCFITLAIFSLLIFVEDLRGGDMGLLITEYIGLLSSLEWGIRQWSELENQMTSTERVIEYKYIENEPKRPAITNLPKKWPSEGRLEFKDVNLRYKETDPYVLKDISFTVEPKEKIGIVGRTGAGKSSIITSLFQLYPIEGSIFIDGIDTTKLPLEDVRNKISIIPQEPVLFSGTMRKNLDPFDEYSDEVLWNALEQVELKETIDEMTQGLNSLVSDSGSNFSVGERQLVCLARALIRHNKILVLDEATANVDPYTDSLIQKTIRNKFADCTVLTVAHRLNTVMDSDKILVMRAGRVEEYDHPHILLEKKEGLLYGLVQATGESTSKQLENIAKENYEKIMVNEKY